MLQLQKSIFLIRKIKITLSHKTKLVHKMTSSISLGVVFFFILFNN